MNLLGKILVVGILIMSLMFMMMALTVYSTHRNWKDQAEGLQQNLSVATTQNTELKGRLDGLDAQLEAEILDKRQQLTKLETERRTLIAQRGELEKEKEGWRTKNRELTSVFKSTQDRLTSLLKEVAELRTEVSAAQRARDDSFAKTVSMTEQVQQQLGALQRANETLDQLKRENATYRRIVSANDIDPNSDPDQVPPRIDGVVTGVRQDRIEVSIGSDDGLHVGHTVDVYRGGSYLGRAVVTKTTVDKAVGKLLKDYRKGAIQKGDRVATRLKIS